MKEKNKNIMKEEEYEIDIGKIQSFLSSAIVDISGYIKFSDTKVSIIMATLGIIIGGIANCRSAIYKTYKAIPECSIVKLAFLGGAIIFLISVIMVYFWGLQTIKSHTSKIAFDSLWFIKEDREKYPFDIYKNKVKKMTPKDIVETMAAELYKLNDINKQKMNSTGKTIKAFSVTLLAILFEILICICVNF